MKIRLNLIATFLVLMLIMAPFSIASAQITIAGTVISSTSEIVPYSTVRLKQNDSTGTITNKDGYFELNLAGAKAEDTLLISHIGEGQYINSVKNTIEMDSFRLQSNTMVLSEVTITTSAFSAIDTIKKALGNYDSNHWSNDVQLTAFYREYGAQNNRWGRFFEADVTVDNFGALNLNENMRIMVNQARKSVDAFENTKDATNPFYTLYRPLRFNLSGQQFEYMDIQDYEDKVVYVIRFYNSGKEGDYEGEIFLNAEDLSFLEINAHLSDQGKNRVRNKGWGKINDKVVRYKNYRRKNDLTLKFKKYKHKYILGTIIKEGIWTAESKDSKVVYDYTTNFLVTGVREEFDQITDSEAIEKTEDLLIKNYEYKEGFWENYNYLIADKKQKEILNELTPIR